MAILTTCDVFTCIVRLLDNEKENDPNKPNFKMLPLLNLLSQIKDTKTDSGYLDFCLKLHDETKIKELHEKPYYKDLCELLDGEMFTSLKRWDENTSISQYMFLHGLSLAFAEPTTITPNDFCYKAIENKLDICDKVLPNEKNLFLGRKFIVIR